MEDYLYQINLIQSFLIKSALQGGPRDLVLRIGLIGYEFSFPVVNQLSDETSQLR